MTDIEARLLVLEQENATLKERVRVLEEWPTFLRPTAPDEFRQRVRELADAWEHRAIADAQRILNARRSVEHRWEVPGTVLQIVKED